MSLIIARNFKREKAHDAAAQDIKLPFIITFNNGKKEFREGYSEEEVRRRFDKSVAALYGGIKSVKLEDEDRRNGKDSIAADAKFKVGDRVWFKAPVTGAKVTAKITATLGGEKYGFVDDDGIQGTIEGSAIHPLNSRAADACGTDAKLQKGDKVRVWQQPVYGKLGEIVEATYGSMEYTVNVEGKDYPRIDYRYIVKVSDAASDADNSRAMDAEFKVGDKVKLSGSHPRFPNKVGVVTHVFPTGFVKVKVDGAEDIEIAERLISAADSCATDYDPNPQTRGKDIEVFSAQAIREESACENVLRKVIEDVEALVIKIHGPMSSWEEVIENSEMSPELPQAKKWSGTANRRYDYLLARERAISSILSELKRNHID